MYKITLYDYDLCPICDGTTFWFVEDLSEFEENWLPLQCRHNISTIERYYRSKLGEIITDYYSDSADLNIVQQADSKIISEKEYTYTDKEIELINAYAWDSKVEFDKLVIKLRVLQYADEYYLVGQYIGTGCRRISPGWNRWYDTETKYAQMNFYGNPIATYLARDINWDDFGSSDRYKDFYTNDKDFYKHEKVETFVWLPIKEVDEQYKIKRLTKKELAILMRDIVGEAG
ncbi:MAG: hypothetical protein IJ763_06265 [Lachnospiraceae bacterium]|nr:hypothetical protein [Lachnospiraceae bacterium]